MKKNVENGGTALEDRLLADDDGTIDVSIEKAIQAIRQAKCGCACNIVKIRIVCPKPYLNGDAPSRNCGKWKIIDCKKNYESGNFVSSPN